MRIGLAAVAGLLLSTNAQAGAEGTSTCTAADEMIAEQMYDLPKHWSHVKVMFDRYQQCEDGGIAEGNSETIARLLVDHWSRLPQLDRLSRVDHRFRHWVLLHIDSTLDGDDLFRIRRLARDACPSGGRVLCRSLAQAAADAGKRLRGDLQRIGR